MQVNEAYEIIEFTQDEGVFVSKARDRKSGKLVQIHQFPKEKGPEAGTICAALLNLPADARSEVLKYWREGTSTYFVTEFLPEGELLRDWVARRTQLSAPPPIPEVGAGTVRDLRRLPIEPAPLRPVPPGPEARPRGAMGPPVESQAPPVPPEPRVRPMRTVDEPAPGGSHGDLRFSKIYGSHDLKTPEPSLLPEIEPEAPVSSRESGPGLDTFIGLSPGSAGRTHAPPPLEPVDRMAPPQREIPAVDPGPPPRITKNTITFPAPPRQTREADLFVSQSPMPAPVEAPAPPPPTRTVRLRSAPRFSAGVAALAALGLTAAGAIVVLIVELAG